MKSLNKNKRVKQNRYNRTKQNFQIVKGQFPLNTSNSDRLSFSAEIEDTNEMVIINNVSYEMFYAQKWKWIIRYDDHGGTEEFHRHERYSLEDESDFSTPYVPIPIISKKELFEWAINDIKQNYLEYRTKFCKRNSIDLY